MTTRAETQEMVKVMQAYVEGKEVECRSRCITGLDTDNWKRLSNPAWDWKDFDYRVKPAPREWWLVSTHSTLEAYPNPQGAQKAIKDCCGDSSLHGVIHVREVLDE